MIKKEEGFELESLIKKLGLPLTMTPKEEVQIQEIIESLPFSLSEEILRKHNEDSN